MTRRILVPALSIALVLASCSRAKEPVDYVNPYIGNISHLLVPTYPTVQLPNSMLRVYPERADYTDEYLNGLPIVVTTHRESSAFRLSVTTGEAASAVIPQTYDNETITPYSYSVTLADGAIGVRFAVSHQSAMYEFSSDKALKLVLASFGGEVGSDAEGFFGTQTVRGNTKVYVYMQTLRQPEVSKADDGSYMVLDFGEGKVNVRYGVSFISCEQAKKNLEREISGYDIAALEKEGRRIWNEALSGIKVKGPDKRKEVFYTAMYRCLERPICYSEDGRYWSAFDSSVQEDGGTPFYNDDWLWDTYRAAHPLRILTNPRQEEDILASFLRMAEQSDDFWLPTFPDIAGDSRRMNSNHTIASFADAIAKGLKVDIPSACDAAYRTLTEKTLAPWSGVHAGELDRFYWKNGYVAALGPGEAETDPVVHGFEKRQSVAVSLGTAYDCWCLARIARAAAASDSRNADYEALAERFDSLSLNYVKLFNPRTLFFHPKDASGRFIEGIDYDFPGGLGAREYYDENNAWVFRWDVQHDIPGLISLMGGPEAFCSELDRMFSTPMGMSKSAFYAKLPDHTGNVGQFSMANEPSLHIPYLYNYAGAPWKTQKRIRQMLDTWFRGDLMGIPGDEDGGGLSSFVVFSSLGFYPVTPGSDKYAIGSPVFSDASIRLGNGKTFRIIADGCSDANKYIASATLNGKALDEPFITHGDILSGGTLRLVMSDKPAL